MDINLNPVPEELRVRYLARRSKDIEDCYSRLTEMDWAYFERLGHQLKGNAPSYGYDDLGRIARNIEESALAKDPNGIEKHLAEFKTWIKQHTS